MLVKFVREWKENEKGGRLWSLDALFNEGIRYSAINSYASKLYVWQTQLEDRIIQHYRPLHLVAHQRYTTTIWATSE